MNNASSKEERHLALAMAGMTPGPTGVAADLADHCEVQLSYGIGVAEPTSFYVKTNGTGKKDDESLTKLARELFPLRPGEIVAHLDLKKPRYRKTAAYGHFGRELKEFTWEKTDMVETLLLKL